MPRPELGNVRAVNYSGRDMDTRTIAVIALIVAVVVLILIL